MLEKLAFSIGRKDEKPNIELALKLLETNDRKGIGKIAEGLHHSSNGIANDCIKVLYEIAERKPQFVSGYVEVFLDLLKSRNNRLVWGTMTALSKIARLKPAEIFDRIEEVIGAYEKGSVITVDNAVSVFAELAKADRRYEKKLFPLLIRHLENCRPKEVGQHAERAFVCVSKSNAAAFRKALNGRLDSLTALQKKRVEKILKNMENGRMEK